ncbi:MAG: hypothetical protein V3T70_11930, partial [Phycisphaerae bacterium]
DLLLLIISLLQFSVVLSEQRCGDRIKGPVYHTTCPIHQTSTRHLTQMTHSISAKTIPTYVRTAVNRTNSLSAGFVCELEQARRGPMSP